jgi:peptide/nickel transport system substrate-binding protein
LGKPNIQTLNIQAVNLSNQIDIIRLNLLHIANPPASVNNVRSAEELNFNFQRNQNGYGYIGINAERISDINIRKGLMHVLTNRESVIQTYFGAEARIPERSMALDSWAYPTNAGQFYNYSIAEAQRFFEAAGYSLSGNRMERNGTQLTIEVGINGFGFGNHPAYMLLTQAKVDLASIGVELIIRDIEARELNRRVANGEIDMWVGEWASSASPDMYARYHGASNTNPFRIKDATLDSLIMNARGTLDHNLTLNAYSQALDHLMGLAVEMPLYRNDTLVLYNQNMVSESNMPTITPYWGVFDEIHRMRMR